MYTRLSRKAPIFLLQKYKNIFTAPNETFNNLKVLEMGPLRFSKGDLYKNLPAEKVTFMKVTFSVGKVL